MADEKLTPAEERRVGAALSIGAQQEAAANKRDAAAARELPALYERLANARQMLERAKADTDLNVHVVKVIVTGDDLEHRPVDKKAWADLLRSDLQAAVTELEGKITALGFDPK